MSRALDQIPSGEIDDFNPVQMPAMQSQRFVLNILVSRLMVKAGKTLRL